MTTRVPLCCSQTLRFCGSGMVMRSPKPRTPRCQYMSNERFSCIRMTTCSTSLMVPVRLFAGIASARRMAGGTSTWRSGPRSRRRRCRKRRLPAWTRSLSDFTDSFLSRYWAGRGSGRATQFGLGRRLRRHGRVARIGLCRRPCRCRRRPATRSASAPRPGAGHGAGSEKFMLSLSLEHQGNSSNIDLPDSASDLTSSSVSARDQKPGRRNTWCRGLGAGAAHAVLAGAVLVQPRKGP